MNEHTQSGIYDLAQTPSGETIKRDKKEDNSENPGTGVARGRRSLDTKFSFKHDGLSVEDQEHTMEIERAPMSILFVR